MMDGASDPPQDKDAFYLSAPRMFKFVRMVPDARIAENRLGTMHSHSRSPGLPRIIPTAIIWL
ncbi:hypothetical protein GCM10022398_28330 [Acetobacter lovaniensis]|nr:hypothetical protein AA0474_2381 [Acetobacter lovaniensis NRIC 0474]